MAYQDGENNKYRYNSSYTAEEAEVVDKAKRTHKETTASAMRAQKTAERTKELAASTLAELQDQGQKLDIIDRDLHDIDADVDESKSVLSYMRRCCLCFLCSCCCDGDRDVARDRTRKMRVKAQNQARSQEKEMYARAADSRKEAPPSATIAAQAPESEEVARGELFQKAGRVNVEERRRQRAAQRNPAYAIGEGLAEEDREEIHAETEKQEEAFDHIGAALGDLKRMGHEMNDELQRQEAVLDAVTDHTDRTNYEIQSVASQARRDFKVRPKPASGGMKRQVLQAATKFV